ncbi:MAG: deoxyguanosinetriphosphate triphosphohydrolase [Ruminococcaceae bacterium]|nr:deoxyguanosinetriphosphate triphosphohydrolase [Oscillospiraceae bacterium]
MSKDRVKLNEADLRRRFELREEMILEDSPYATHSASTKGRERPMEPCPMRTEFQRDRDRIIHCQSFRRLMYKTQVFLAPAGDHYRTRLTHTLEVCQVARTMARALRLNEDLTEAAALGHDLGHTPFGHAGEDALRQCYDPNFAHYEQSLRVVECLENNGKGLNLTWEVRDAIVNHTGKSIASTPEGVLIKFADRIAYINHDIDDACRAGILRPDDIPRDICAVLGNTHGDRIDTMVSSVIAASDGKAEISMTSEVQAATDRLRAFLFENVYKNPVAKGEEAKAKELVYALFDHFVKHPDKMPPLYVRMVQDGEAVERCVADFISGMTDRYAIETYGELFIPRVWRGLHE